MKVFELKQAESPLVISVPHDGAFIPEEILSTMNPKVLDSTDRDYLIDQVFEFQGIQYSKIKANYSRHVIDLNRPASGEALYKNQAETELCPTTTFDYKGIYQAGKKPGASEIERRIVQYWQPYHVQLEALIETAKNKFGYCLLIDAHSIDDEVPRFFDGQLPDINIGTNEGATCATEITQILLDHLSAQEQFSFVSNGRFKGGFITRNYGQPEKNVHAIQLEHAKSSYLDKNLELSNKGRTLNCFWKNTLIQLLDKLSKVNNQ